MKRINTWSDDRSKSKIITLKAINVLGTWIQTGFESADKKKGKKAGLGKYNDKLAGTVVKNAFHLII